MSLCRCPPSAGAAGRLPLSPHQATGQALEECHRARHSHLQEQALPGSTWYVWIGKLQGAVDCIILV